MPITRFHIKYSHKITPSYNIATILEDGHTLHIKKNRKGELFKRIKCSLKYNKNIIRKYQNLYLAKNLHNFVLC